MSEMNLIVKIRPLVLFTIIDSYERRSADSRCVIGSLLGCVENGVVEVTNCFCVPHKEQNEILEVKYPYSENMITLNRQVFANEAIVGWWATGNKVTTHNNVIHNYYVEKCKNPVLLTVDTSLKDGHMGLKAYIRIPVGVPGGKPGIMFTPVVLKTIFSEPETIGIKFLRNTITASYREHTKIISPKLDIIQIYEACKELEENLDLIIEYVENVIAQKEPANNAVGRQLMSLIHSMPYMSPEDFTKIFQKNIKDLLMIITVSVLAKTQLEITEKLALMPATK